MGEVWAPPRLTEGRQLSTDLDRGVLVAWKAVDGRHDKEVKKAQWESPAEISIG